MAMYQPVIKDQSTATDLFYLVVASKFSAAGRKQKENKGSRSCNQYCQAKSKHLPGRVADSNVQQGYRSIRSRSSSIIHVWRPVSGASDSTQSRALPSSSLLCQVIFISAQRSSSFPSPPTFENVRGA